MDTLKIFADYIFQFGLLINAALFVPQAIRVYNNHSATGLSLITYIGYNTIQLLIALHGLIHHDYILLYGMLLSLFTSGLVTIGIIIFDKPWRKNI